MYNKQEVESTKSSVDLTPLPYAANYLKFCSPSNSPLENAKAVLGNYCKRDWLQWAPTGPLQRMGKNRSTKNIDAVDQALTNPALTSVPMLIAAINDKVKDYSSDSSLLKRLVFICAMENIPCQMVNNKGGLSLQLGMPELSSINHSSMHSTKTDSSTLLWQSYKQYPLLEQYKDSETIAREDRQYKGVMVTNDPAKLKLGANYLYVATLDGQIWFAPQFVSGEKLTHGGLARQVNAITGSDPTAVLAAGTIAFGAEAAIFNLASGHFAPDFEAYFPLMEALHDKLPSHILKFQEFHYKNLDEGSCNRVSLDAIEGLRSLKLNLINYLQDPPSDLSSIAYKIFTNINVAGKDFKEGITFSKQELTTLFDDSELSSIVKESLIYCPEDIQEFSRPLSTSMAF